MVGKREAAYPTKKRVVFGLIVAVGTRCSMADLDPQSTMNAVSKGRRFMDYILPQSIITSIKFIIWVCTYVMVSP